MNSRSGWVTFFIILLLILMIVTQVLSMVQSDRLYRRLNQLIELQKQAQLVKTVHSKTN